ncbi:hypothetical protein AnigIFM63604_004261 [Aspergillus niger]|uniref:Uncharacterized protein n=1 Tax=Aspergillus niger TaxID=5061 RepID=A0A9W6A0L5_ASPNG|nr:hypothetical protein AnigIFM63604_004261 [Aspergillus niger]
MKPADGMPPDQGALAGLVDRAYPCIAAGKAVKLSQITALAQCPDEWGLRHEVYRRHKKPCSRLKAMVQRFLGTSTAKEGCGTWIKAADLEAERGSKNHGPSTSEPDGK